MIDMIDAVTATAPDGATVHILAATGRGSMAHFTFPAETVAPAVRHRTVDEVWFIVGGSGQMWQRDSSGTETLIDLEPDRSLAIPLGVTFQVRTGPEPLRAVGVTMPPWPGDDEAELVDGAWEPTSG